MKRFARCATSGMMLVKGLGGHGLRAPGKHVGIYLFANICSYHLFLPRQAWGWEAMSDRKDLEEALGIAPADIDGWWYGGEELGGGLGFKPSLMAVLKAPRISPIFTGLLEVISVRVSRGEPRTRFFSRKKNGAESSNTMQGADMINANAQGRPNLVDLMRESRNSRRRSEPAEATEPGTRAPSRRSSAPTPSVARSSSSSLSRGSSRSSSLAPSVLQSGAPTQEPTTSTSAQPPTPGPNTDLSNLRSRTAPSVQLPALGFGIFYSRVLPFLGPSGQSAFAASGAFHPLVPCKGITSERVAEFTKNSDEAAAAAREEVMLMLPAELVPLEELERSFKWVANETTAARGQKSFDSKIKTGDFDYVRDIFVGTCDFNSSRREWLRQLGLAMRAARLKQRGLLNGNTNLQ
jgi:hypothetical protein